jgi:hypothetical protein
MPRQRIEVSVEDTTVHLWALPGAHRTVLSAADARALGNRLLRAADQIGRNRRDARATRRSR